MKNISRILLFLLFASLANACTDEPNENSDQKDYEDYDQLPNLPETDGWGNRVDSWCTKTEAGNSKCSNTDPNYLYICNGEYYRRGVGCAFGCDGKDACIETAPLGTTCNFDHTGSWCDNNNVVWCSPYDIGGIAPSVVVVGRKCEDNEECVLMEGFRSAQCINRSIQCKTENERIGWCETIKGMSAEGSYVCKYAKNGSLVPVNQYYEYSEYKLCSNGCNDTNTACK